MQITMSKAEDVIEAANATAPVETTGGKSKGVTAVSELEKLKATGREIVSKMSAEEKAILSSKSDTITFLGYVVMNSKKEMVHRQQLDDSGNVIYQKDENGNDKLDKNGKRMPATATESPKAVGVVFVSTEDVTVPVIDARYTTANFDATVKVDTRVVPAGEKIVLTLLEAMRFLAQPEYSTQFKVEANPALRIKANTGFITLNTKAFASGQSKLPSVSFNFQKDCGAPRDLKALFIDKQDASGKWVLNDAEPDAARFAFMLEPKKGSRPKKEVAPKDPAADRYAVAAAIRNLLGM